MKVFAKTLGIIALVLMLLLLVLNGVNVEIPEGQEPTKAQQLLLDIKANVNLIAGALGTTTSAIVGFLMVVIQKSSTITGDNTAKLIAEGATTNGKIDNLQTKTDQNSADVAVLAKKLDMLMSMLTDTLLLSDLPVTVREQVNTTKGAYLALGTETVKPEQVTAPTTNTAQNVNAPVKPTETAEEKPTAPSYF
nr:MAG TPA: hypothetical protein [Caudoviricetes sp.]